MGLRALGPEPSAAGRRMASEEGSTQMRDRAGQVRVWVVRVAIGFVLVVVLAVIAMAAIQLER